jgi:hypothetical protein
MDESGFKAADSLVKLGTAFPQQLKLVIKDAVQIDLDVRLFSEILSTGIII